MSAVKVLLRWELSVNVPVAIFFRTKDCIVSIITLLRRLLFGLNKSAVSRFRFKYRFTTNKFWWRVGSQMNEEK